MPLQEKYQLRFKVLEERFKSSSHNGVSCAGSERTMSNGCKPRQSLGGVENLSRSSSSRFSSRNLLKNGITSSKVYDSSKLADLGHADEKDKSKPEDFVSGMLYDMLQKEVLTLQKACHQKDQNIKDKNNTIEVSTPTFYKLMLSPTCLIFIQNLQVLARNVETLNKAMEVESKRTRRELAVMEKELSALRVGKQRESHMGRRTIVPRLDLYVDLSYLKYLMVIIISKHNFR